MFGHSESLLLRDRYLPWVTTTTTIKIKTNNKNNTNTNNYKINWRWEWKKDYHHLARLKSNKAVSIWYKSQGSNYILPLRVVKLTEEDWWALLIKSTREIRLITNIIFTHITSQGIPTWFCAVFLLKQHLCTNIFITEHVK